MDASGKSLYFGRVGGVSPGMSLFRIAAAALLLALLAVRPAAARADTLDRIARDYVHLTLEIGERDPAYVDAYYGPAGWRRAAHAHPRTLVELAAAAEALEQRVLAIREPPASLEARRRAFLAAQLHAAGLRLRLLRGGTLTFEEEARGMYGIDLRVQPLAVFDPVLARIEQLVPGQGPLADRVEAFQDRFVIPRDRLEAVMRAAIAECRRRTLAHITLPREESFTLEFVTHQSWSGYNWYQGHYRSLIQVNTDFPVRMSRAVDLGCHEGYPGHHVYNMLLERILARGRDWIEFTIYPLYSPQSFIAEGTANYGIELAFPGTERATFERSVLYPLAGLSSADADAYAALQRALQQLSGARFTIASDLVDGRITRDQAIALTQRYGLVSRPRAEQVVAFTEHYRAYVINYGLGQMMVRAAIEATGTTPAARWAAMWWILSGPTIPENLAVPAG
jgi:hypothetical protein